MRAAQQWGQILFGVGVGLLIGAVTSYFKHAPQAAAVALLLASLCIAAGLYLLRRGG